MEDKHCAICLAKLEREDAPIIAMGGYGVPRYLCDECAEDVERATEGIDFADIDAAMDRISEKLVKSNVDDPLLLSTLTILLGKAAERAEKIKDGTYNPDLEEDGSTKVAEGEEDEQADDEDADAFDEIPEELLETEEDRLQDEADAAFESKVNKVLDWVWLAILVGAVAFMIWWFFFR